MPRRLGALDSKLVGQVGSADVKAVLLHSSGSHYQVSQRMPSSEPFQVVCCVPSMRKKSWENQLIFCFQSENWC